MTTTRTLPGGLVPARRGIGPRTAHDPGDPLITSHCPFCGSGQVVGRSDGTIGCDFCGQNYIVRVQPAFPGMPQVPSGPGAPSDIGPDGGLVDPGMIGPDGMPQDGGMPPDGEEGDEGPPFGDDEDAGPAGGSGSDGTPPPADGNSDSKKDSSGKGGPPKGKAKKKSSRRVAASDYPRYSPHEREVLPLHMMSHHGWTPGEVREAMQWPEGASVLPRHHDAEHAQFGTAIQYLHVPHAHADLSHGDPGAPAWRPPPVPDAPPDWLGREGRYHGLQGQPLTEDQLVRHLAVSLSGRHPAVLATLRREAAARMRAAR